MRRPECMEQKFGQTQMTAVWKECTRMENAGKRKWVCSLFFVFLLLMGISFTALAAPQAGLNKTKLTMIKGTAEQLVLSGDISGKITWKSSKKSVVTVSATGRLKAKKKGTATVMARADGKTYRCKVTVKQPVTSIRLNQKSIAISAGKTYTLKAKVKPTNANLRTVTWTSSDKSIVTVTAKGKLKAVSSGKAVITATAKDGSGKKATCRILVKAPAQPKADKTITLDSSSLTLQEGKTAILKATTSDGEKVVWGTSDRDIVSVTNGTLAAKKAGTATIAARRLDGAMTVFCKVTVTAGTGRTDTKKDSTADASADIKPQAGESALARKFLNVLQNYSNRIQSDSANGAVWRYSNSGAASTWSAALSAIQKKGYTYCNCALLPRWGLRELGIIDSKNFWGLAGGGIQFRGNVKEQLLKHCEIIKVYKTPNQLLAEGNLLPGDICTWVEYQHTNVYAGDGLWYDSGRSGAVGGYQNGTFVFKTFGPAATVNMSGTTVGYIIRLIK